ncbi:MULTISPECIES: helix-turn-helix domain-containing protein [Pseudomonadaceae]|jgi:transcriptional regulator with XRE-family HTH domain|uniref:Helix-turn-helix transcriptional regulator n=7 Tax=Gammaproteobacteria TaxID=1236 RepID=A0A5M8FMV1_PSEVE|nr:MULTISPECIES: helix-turn-helix transcriptional regulator [Pseudomonadaceae]MAL92060.1 XRE family transcriptional regulator [Pseudomonas sp.]MBT9570246.1 helix-turn-helix transcriptional regulator [Pseudomonas umsongensis]MDP9687643.1 transcriptional regulator with XRE-family HTH domain [Pseudomonas mohnii]OHC70826.1 MAG: transcriptional regulator [Pseudomonadales bacterium RIFCSPLOWO2_02_FULL_63_210]AHC35767.1 DNA-binding protein [Pseudomonas sp. TKP]|tara:strand:+ start:3692 stop:3982 length:291 start_codon:yes stop_codon:yes gene_type:complete
MELNEALGLVIRNLRISKDMPQEGLGPSQSYISAIERGKWKPSIEKVEQIAEIIGIHPLTLLFLAYQRQTPELKPEDLLKKIHREITSLKGCLRLE